MELKGKSINYRCLYIVIASIIAIILLYFVDQILLVSYNIKILIKLILFGVFPLIYIRNSDYNFIKKSFENRNRKMHSKSIILGVLAFVLTLLFYNIVKETINVENLMDEFQTKYLIEGKQIIYYGMYITIINSFLEEFFFRGFIFLNLLKLGYRKTGYIFTPLMFSLYHIANIKNWFSLSIFLVTVMGLFLVGLLFNKLDEKEEDFKNSWFVHACVDAAVVLIGYKIMV